jgi:hypothetical protein
VIDLLYPSQYLGGSERCEFTCNWVGAFLGSGSPVKSIVSISSLGRRVIDILNGANLLVHIRLRDCEDE